MSAIPAVPDSESRATTVRAPADESRATSETKFQDAVDSRRAERAQAAAKHEDVRDSRVHDREVSSKDDDQNRSDAADETPTETPAETPSDSTKESRAQTQGSGARANKSGEQAAVHEDTASRRTLRAPKTALPTGSTERSSTSDETAPGIPLFGQAALEALIAQALPHGPLSGASGVATESASANLAANSGVSGGNTAAHVAPQAAGLVEQPTATQKSPTTVAIEALPLGGPQHEARDVSSPSRTIDARGALAAIAAPRTSESPVAEAPITARLAPAELPKLFERLAVRIDMPDRSALVHLEPPELGPMRISLSVEPGGHVRAEMQAQRPDGYAALEARMPELHKSLIERGFTSASLNLSLGFADSHARGSGSQREQWNSSSAGRRTLSDREVRAMLPASVGAIDMWA